MSALAQTSLTSLPLFFLAPIGALGALLFAFIFYKGFMAKSEGEPEMVRIAAAVRQGAYAYLRRQAKIVFMVIVALVILLSIIAFGLGLQDELTPLGVFIAACFSGTCGFLGMKTATSASARTTAAAKQSLNDGLKVAFRAGAVMGLCVTGFALLDVSIWFFVLTSVLSMENMDSLVQITNITLSFAMGASLQALFARVGGGIYTKAADVGADLVGKVEAGIPEDDARNPATIADNVGDNVGDVAGMGADLYESYYGSILAAMALAAAAAVRVPAITEVSDGLRLVVAAPALAGLGILASIISIFAVRTKENASFAQLLHSLHAGVWLSSGLIVIGSAILLKLLIGDVPHVHWYGLWGSIVAGLLAGLVIAWGTERYTSYEHKPTQRISKQAETGPATVIIAGIAEGMVSTWIPLLTIVVAIMCAFIFAGGRDVFLMGVFGVGIAAVGMLSTLGITLATDAYGPIADNAGGNAEMTGQKPEVRQRTDALDALGNTTAATGKGFAIGSAALTAMALLAAYVEEVRFGQLYEARDKVVAVFEQPAADQAVFLGHGKFASWLGGDGKKTEHFEAFMALDLSPDLTKELGLEAGVTRITLGPEGNVDNKFIRETRLGPAGNEHEVRLVPTRRASMLQFMDFYGVTLMNPKVLCGLFSGVLLAFVFCSLTMKAVGRAANAMMIECRRQFEKIRQSLRNEGKDENFVQNPDNWPKRVNVDNHQYPDYANCVAISTAGAQKEMILPALMAIIVPVLVGLVFGVPGVMGLLAGGLTSGFALAIFMANAGGAWDNAKKLIETYGKIKASEIVNDPAAREKLPPSIRADLVGRAEMAVRTGKPDTIIYGKGSEDHKAGVVGDTVGDPFKDTSGPSLNILIKLMSMVSVVFAGLIVKYAPQIGAMLGLGG